MGRGRAPAALAGAVAGARSRPIALPPPGYARLDARGGARRAAARPARRPGAGRRRTRWRHRSGLPAGEIAGGLGGAGSRGLRDARPLHAGRERATNGASAGCSRASIATRSTGCARDRAGRPARLPALPVRLAARVARAQVEGPETLAPARPARRLRGARRRLGNRDPAGAAHGLPAGLARRARALAGRTWIAGAAPGAPPGGDGRPAPVRTTPIAVLARRHAALWRSTAPPADPPRPGPRAQAVVDFMTANGASFFDELLQQCGLLRSQLEDALAELVALGLVTSDSFAGLRALLVPSGERTPIASGRRRRRTASFGMEDAGRWSLIRQPAGAADRSRPGRGRARRARAAAPLRRGVLAPAGARGRGCRRGAICCGSIAGSRRAARSAAAGSSPVSPASSSPCRRRSGCCARSGAAGRRRTNGVGVGRRSAEPRRHPDAGLRPSHIRNSSPRYSRRTSGWLTISSARPSIRTCPE